MLSQTQVFVTDPSKLYGLDGCGDQEGLASVFPRVKQKAIQTAFCTRIPPLWRESSLPICKYATARKSCPCAAD